MSFLNWSILFGLAAVVIPIIIHLFNRRKARVIDWGAMQFLMGSLVNRKRRILVEEMVLMALRCLLVATLVLAFARPFAPVDSGVMWLVVVPVLLVLAVIIAVATILARSVALRMVTYTAAVVLAVGVISASRSEHLRQAARWQSSTAQDIAIIIDGSSSMRAEVDGASNFQRAVNEARQLVQSLGPDDNISVILAGGAAETLTPEPISVRGDTEKIFAQLEPSGGALSVVDALSTAAATLAASTNPLKKIVVISDGQNVGWQPDNAGRWEFLAGTLEQLPTVPRVVSRFLPLPERFQNAAVTVVEASRAIIGTDRSVRFRVQVENTGYETIEPSGLQLRLDDQNVLTSEVGALEPGESVQLDFEHHFRSAGVRAVEAQLLVKDDLVEDDRHVHVVQVLDALPVLLVDGSAEVRKSEQATVFAEIALSPPDESAADGAAAAPLLSPTVIAAPDLNERTRFEDYRVVMLVDVPRLGAETAKNLSEFVRRGGGLLIAPGRRCEAEFYNNWKTSDGTTILPARFDRRVVIAADGQPAHPAAESFQHNALTRLVSASQSDLSQAVVSAYWRLDPQEADARVFVGANLDGGAPLLVERPVGDGLVGLTAVSLDAEGSTFPSLASFLPFIHELTYHLASPASMDWNQPPTRVLTVNVPHRHGGETSNTPARLDEVRSRSVEVTTPSGRTRRGTLQLQDKRSSITFPGAVQPGLYFVELPDDIAGQFSDKLVAHAGKASLPLSILPAAEESRLAPVTEDDESLARRYLDYFRAADTEQMVAAVTGEVPGHELWKFLAVVAVMIVLAESFVTRWIAGRRKQGAARTVDFVSEGERMSTFQQRAKEMLETVRAK